MCDENESIDLNELCSDLYEDLSIKDNSIIDVYLKDRQQGIEKLHLTDPILIKINSLFFNGDIKKEDQLLLSLINNNVGDCHCHLMFMTEILNNILQIIFKRGRYNWVDQYIEHAENIQKDSIEISGYNHKNIKLLSEAYDEEWGFSRIICNSPSTITLLHTMFEEIIKLDEFFQFKSYIFKIYEYFFQKMQDVNLFVVFNEYLKIVQHIKTSHILYYQLCAIATHVFSQLAYIDKQRDFYKNTSNFKEDSLDKLRDMFKNVLMIYFVARYIELFPMPDLERLKKCKFMLCTCLVDPTMKNAKQICLALDVSLYLRALFSKTTLSLQGSSYLNYLSCYIVPFTLHSNQYIENLIVSIRNKSCSRLNNLRIVDKMNEYYNLVQFIHTN